MATTSMSRRPDSMIDRRILRPMRPKPLIATRTAMKTSSGNPKPAASRSLLHPRPYKGWKCPGKCRRRKRLFIGGDGCLDIALAALFGTVHDDAGKSDAEGDDADDDG